jgi:polyhydroxyalkanoate synthesis regulator phasin
MNTTLKSIILAAAASLSVVAHAGDKEVLDLLVKKGVISAEERAKAIQEAKIKASDLNLNEVFSKEDAVRRLTFSGRMQTQYEGASYEQTTAGVTTEARATSTMLLRRMYLGVKADVGDGFSGELVYNFADSTTDSGSDTVRAGAFDKAVFTAETSFGKFDVGYQKVMFGYEENTSSSGLFTVERSMVTRYWAEGENNRRLGLGARHVGVHYSNRQALGEVGEGDLRYGISAVNARQGYNDVTVNDYGFYAFASFGWKPSGLTIGVNAFENQRFEDVNTALGGANGINPYLRWEFKDFTLVGEYISSEIESHTAAPGVATGTNGTVGQVLRKPTGYNVTAAYKLTEKLELVARYSVLDTDGRGVRVSDGFRDVQNAPLSSTTYNESDSVFVGMNYYFNKNNAKIQFGYERANLDGRFSTWNGTTGSANVTATDTARADIFRVQAQILF